MRPKQKQDSRHAILRTVSLCLLLTCGPGCRMMPQLREKDMLVWADPILDSAKHEETVETETTLEDVASESIGFVKDLASDTATPKAFESTLDEESFEFQSPTILEILYSDQLHFYSREHLRPFMLTLGGSAILANTQLDQEFTDWYQNDVRSESSDDIAKFAKVFGEQWPMMGAYLTASIGGRLLPNDSHLAHWGDRSMRSMFVGVPPLLFMQKALGSSRPNESPIASNWDFWADENGASGHAFVGAVPFLVAAQMAKSPRHKATWLALSTLPGWSRINDDNHYLSQVVMGWWLAYTATHSVRKSDDSLNYQISPWVIEDSLGLEMVWKR